MFEIAERLSKNFFRRCIHDSFQNPHLRECSKEPNDLKEFFLRVDLGIFSSSTPHKIFKIDNQLQRNFFRRCIHNSFESLHLRKFLKLDEQLQRIFFEGVFTNPFKICTQENLQNKTNNFKDFFQRCIQEYFQVMHLRKYP